MAIDCIKSGPAKYRTKLDNNFEQFCYFYQNKKDGLFNKLLAERVEENNSSLVFKIDSVIKTTKNGETKIYRAIQKLKHLTNRSDGNDRGSDRQQIAEQSKLVDRKYFGGGKKMGEDLNFLFNNNASQPKKRKYETKKIKPYNTTRIKSKNLFNQDFLQRSHRGRLVGQKFCF